LGNTPAEIHARFAGLIEQNFRTGDPNKIVHALTSHELADLAAVYKRAGGGTLLGSMARKVDAEGLTRVASAFGQTETAGVVEAYAPASVRTLFKTLPVQPAAQSSTRVLSLLQRQGLGGITLDGEPNTDMTPYEVYLVFRTAPLGSLSVASSLYEAGMYMAKPVGIAATLGYGVGTLVNSLITNYDPALEDAIGGTVAGMVDQVQAAVDLATQGQLMEATDALFGTPISFNSPGDFGVTQAMADYSSC
jgi:hypothetical protein